jgi:dihydropyrimidine dehydrogenase (NAD+) subunit PreA
VPHGLAAKRGGAHGVSLINTIKSIIGVDIDRFVPSRGSGLSTNGGYCGAAVKPIALHMVAALAREKSSGMPISGIGGITNWRDAVEFMLLGSSRAGVHRGHAARLPHRRGHDRGPDEYMREHGFATPRRDGRQGRCRPTPSGATSTSTTRPSPRSTRQVHRLPAVRGRLPRRRAPVHPPERPDGTLRVPVVDESECVGCNLCQIVCPVPGCITMVQVPNGFAPRRGTSTSKRARAAAEEGRALAESGLRTIRSTWPSPGGMRR